MGTRPQRAACLVASPLMIAAGGAAWAVVTQQLKAQRIEVPADSSSHAGKTVAGPLTAFAQAVVIEKHALGIARGRTYAEVNDEWLQAARAGDSVRAAELAESRQVVIQANLLRASLFTSVLAYGVSALTIGMGVIVGILGSALDDPSD